MNRFSALVAVSLTGCTFFSQIQFPYYEDRLDPSITGFDVATEAGNAGGALVTVQGAGFGSDPADIVVLFANHNAEILSVSDSAIQVKTPPGPITGGPVDVVVATATGYSTLEDGYTYDMSPATGDSTVYDDQTGYILLQNLWTSCLGGLWDHGGTALEGAGCDTVAYFGQSGLDGSAEFYTFAYPRIHTVDQGWFTGSDYNPGQWTFSSAFDLRYASGVDDLRKHVGGEFTITNPLWQDVTECVDPTVDATDDNAVDCDVPGAVRYDLGTLQMCETEDAVEGPAFLHQADWPVRHDFFLGDGDGDGEGSERDNDTGPFAPVDVELNLPALGLDGFPITLPPSMLVTAQRGFTNDEAWGADSSMSACLDANDDGEARLDEDGIKLTWEPIGDDVQLGGAGTEVGSYVHVSVSLLPLGWFGLTTGAPRASIAVSDLNEFDETTGLSSITIPNSILYQFPTPNFQWSKEDQFSGKGTLGSWDSQAAYMLLEIYRVTDVRVPTGDGRHVVVSYMTGDLAFLSDWANPVEKKSCSDCLDGDGDGWVDALDPDCEEDVGGNGDVEDGTNSNFTCNDGIDNNEDGLTDSEDPLCGAGWDGESTCTDGLDNDEDGWTDADDADCDPANPSDQEDATAAGGTCSDGLDNDGDGWIDVGDPGCVDGRSNEDDGFISTLPCNDGVDNDGHGDIDARDPYCVDVGAQATAEVPTFKTSCADGKDSESATKDGFIDELDPDCEIKPYSVEYAKSWAAGSKPVVPACYDGVDNDGDGAMDAADPSCWRPDLGYAPDGFGTNEGATHGTTCSDNVDSDADGWIDGLDPDCVANDETKQAELGFGTTVCNDGVDNNGDGKTDSQSTYCKSGAGTYEGP